MWGLRKVWSEKEADKIASQYERAMTALRPTLP